MSEPCPRCFTYGRVESRKDGSYKCCKCRKVVPKHTHRWRNRGHSAVSIMEVCSVRGCPGRRERDATPEEKKQIREASKVKFRPKPEHNVHRVWSDFRKRFLGESDEFERTGFALQMGIEKWVKKFPKDAHLVPIDDSWFMSSDLLLVEHKARDRWMGVSAVVIPQNNQTPVQFFLYPGHVEALYKALQAIRKKTRELRRREGPARRKRQRKNPFMG